MTSRSAWRRLWKVKSRDQRFFCASRSSWNDSICSSLDSDTCNVSVFFCKAVTGKSGSTSPQS